MDEESDHAKRWAEEDRTIGALNRYLKSIGLEDLAEEIQEQKYVNRSLKARLTADYWSLSLQLWEMKEDRILQDAIALQSSLFDKSSSYNTVIMTLGYAGFFAIWSNIHLTLTFFQNTLIGALLGSSLLIFIVWTLINSVAITVSIRSRAVLLNKSFESRQDLIEAHISGEQNVDNMVNRIQRWWAFVFTLTALTGLSAGFILLALLIEKMVGFEWSSIFAGIIEKVQ